MQQKVHAEPLCWHAVDWNSTFKMADGRFCKLANIAKEFRERILEDLQRLKFCGINGSVVQNEFVRIAKSGVYVYKHKHYTQACSVDFTSIARACKNQVTETYEAVGSCEKGEQHDDDLMPFFLSNPELIFFYESILSSGGTRKVKAEECLQCLHYIDINKDYRNESDERFFHDHNVYQYEEDTWTKRLFKATALRYSDFNVQYTADARGKACNSIIMTKMPTGTPLDVLLFHGSPDMMLRYKPIAVGSEESKSTGCIETKKNEHTAYMANSIIPQQAGQLIAYIHQMLVALALNKLTEGQQCTAIKGVGLYVMRSGRCILLTVTLSPDPLDVAAHMYFGLRVPSAVLCKGLDTLVSCLM